MNQQISKNNKCVKKECEKKKDDEEEEEEEVKDLNDIEIDGKKKCSLKEHNEIDAILYCPECQIYLCNKCDSHHSALFKNHHNYKLNADISDMFTGLCKEKNHSNKLKYFCKSHNQLCWVECICKIKEKGFGQHKNCDVCLVTKIKDNKKNKLKENIKYLEDLSKNLQESIAQLKTIFEENNKSKEDLKIEIQKVFTKLRNTLNEREDYLFTEIDKKYDELFFKEDLIKDSEKMPKKINLVLEKGKIEDNEWNDKMKLNSLINNCIDIENSIKEINLINDNINKCKSNSTIKIKFNLEKKKFDYILEDIKHIGEIQEEKKNIYTDIDYQGLDKKEVMELFNDLDKEYNLSSIMDIKDVLEKIIEVRCDREEMNNWVFERL